MPRRACRWLRRSTSSLPRATSPQPTRSIRSWRPTRWPATRTCSWRTIRSSKWRCACGRAPLRSPGRYPEREMIRLEVSQGLTAGARHESSADVVRLGRAEGNDFTLPDAHVSGEHARIVFGGQRYFIRDLRSTHGTVVVRAGHRMALDDSIGRETGLETGDVIELGIHEPIVRLVVTLIDEPAPRVLASRRIDDLGAVEPTIERDAARLRSLYAAQKRIGAAADLGEVIASICDAA